MERGPRPSRRDFLKTLGKGALVGGTIAVGVVPAESAITQTAQDKKTDSLPSGTEYREEKKEIDRINQDFRKAVKDKDTKRQMELMEELTNRLKKIPGIEQK